ncbi:MAG: guanylate kinase [Clostridia bacterium]|nr:guanylate kinase [Clostridia bacterium]
MNEQNIRNGIMFSISGPSGVGKGTIVNAVKEGHPNFGVSVSATTRAPRGEEKDGVEYYFKTDEEFDKMIEEGDIIEYDTFVGKRYGTPAAPLKKMVESGEDCLLDITILGSLALKDKFKNDAVTIFVLPPSLEVLAQRLRDRGTESEEKIQERLNTAKSEVLQAGKFDYIVVNDDLDKAVAEVESIITAEHLKSERFKV